MQGRGAQTRDAILDAALSLASVGGLTGLSIGTLAREVGLSKSGLFAHFRSKEELQLELLRAAEHALQREVIVPSMAAAAGLPRLRTFMVRMLG